MDAQTQNYVRQLISKVNDLERKIKRMEQVLANIDANTAQTLIEVRNLKR